MLVNRFPANGGLFNALARVCVTHSQAFFEVNRMQQRFTGISVNTRLSSVQFPADFDSAETADQYCSAGPGIRTQHT
jgi:hypothetical protein